jgi:hypothetical protein
MPTAGLSAKVTFMTATDKNPPAIRLTLTPPLKRGVEITEMRNRIVALQGVVGATITGDGRHVLIELDKLMSHYRDSGVVHAARMICRAMGITIDGDITPAPER